jgi:hypothetical protein
MTFLQLEVVTLERALRGNRSTEEWRSHCRGRRSTGDWCRHCRGNMSTQDWCRYFRLFLYTLCFLLLSISHQLFP